MIHQVDSSKVIHDTIEYGQLPQRALELLRNALTLWPTVNIKFAYFEKLLSPIQVLVSLKLHQ